MRAPRTARRARPDPPPPVTAPPRHTADHHAEPYGVRLRARDDERPATRTLPPGPWQWTDDTEMACPVYRLLAGRGTIDQDALAASFAAHHDFDRGFGGLPRDWLRRTEPLPGWAEVPAGLRPETADWPWPQGKDLYDVISDQVRRPT
ncbi:MULTISPECIES: ADP-ribosylglycohydrolase family protein [Microbispora]|uniref:ADP-ribosylglycohydrolase family protein n=1 Tax=Microbispora TaxID=2005 RepID=UPI0028AD43A5|nr:MULTISPECIES: ADP-ribosylglycohydrolase family protein [Microbispora]